MVVLKRKIYIFDIVNTILMCLTAAIMLYPFLYVLSASLSEPTAVMQNQVKLFPIGLNLINYKYVFEMTDIGRAYLNTITYTVVGTGINILMTMTMAYPLSRRRFPWRGFFMEYVTFTMLFSGGLIPTYLVVRSLHLIDTIWALVLPGAASAFYVIIARTFLIEIPDSLEESAIIDGANEVRIFWHIFVPLSKAIIATLLLFYGVGHWNSFFAPLIYLNSKQKFPLQLVLRSLLIGGDLESQNLDEDAALIVSQSIRYTAIIIATLPILTIYPFVQKYFVKGVMIGSIKG